MASEENAGFANYCPKCSHELEQRHVEGRTRAYCPKCDRPIYRNAKPCAGVLVVDGTEVLLVKRREPPAVGAWSIPAGYLEVEEPPETAAVRELTEETGLTVSEEEVSIFDTNLVSLDDGTRVLVLIFTTARDHTTGTVSAGSDAADAQFWDIDTLISEGEALEPGYEPLFRRAVDRVGER